MIHKVATKKTTKQTQNDKVLLCVIMCIKEDRSLKKDDFLFTYFNYDEALYIQGEPKIFI